MEDFSDHAIFDFGYEAPLPHHLFMVAVSGMAEFHAEWVRHPLLAEASLKWLDNTTLLEWTASA